MHKSLLVLSLISILSTVGRSQDLENRELGFNCGFTGKPTDVVNDFCEYLEWKEYANIIELLKSGMPSEQFLAVISLERLSHYQKIKLEPEIIKLIQQVYQSEKVIQVCDGCSETLSFTIKSLLSNKKSVKYKEVTTSLFDKIIDL